MAAKNEQGKKPQLAYKKNVKMYLTEFEQGQQPLLNIGYFFAQQLNV